MTIPPDEDFFISINDLRSFGYCGKGSRTWAEAHNISWAKFVHEGGIMASTLATNGDGMSHKLIEEMRRRRGEL